MKKLRITLLSSIVVISMILAACSSSGNNNGTPAATVPGSSTTSQPTGSASQMPGSTPSAQVTQPAETTAPAASQPAVTTSPVTQPAATETQPAGGTPSSTQALPSTGAVDPGLVSNLTNFQVVNQQNQQLGTAKDLVLNLDTKKVDYIVLSVGGFLGIGSADIPVPWDAFEMNGSSVMSGTSGSQPNSLTLNVSKNVISQAPQLDTSAMPEINQSSPGWDSKYKSYWQSQLSAGGAATGSTAPGTPAATQAATQPATQMPSATASPLASPQVTATTGVTSTAKLTGVILASKMLNANIEDSSGQSIGSIADVVVDISTGDVQYAVISHTGGGTSSGNPSSSGTSSATQSSSSTQPASTQAPSTSAGQNQWTPVPLETLGWDAQNQAFTLNVDQQTLINAPSFAPGQFPNTQQSGWDSDIQSYWQNNMPSTTAP